MEWREISWEEIIIVWKLLYYTYICSNVNYNVINYNNISFNVRTNIAFFYITFLLYQKLNINLFLSLRFKKNLFSSRCSVRIQFWHFSPVDVVSTSDSICMSEVDQFTDWCPVGKYEKSKQETFELTRLLALKQERM